MTEPLRWHIETRKVSSLIPYFKNPRLLTKSQEEHLKKSLKKFGLIDRPCVNVNGTIIGGHQRIHALKLKPNDEIEVMVPNRLLDNYELEELNLRLNKNTGQWDWDILANEWEIDSLLEYGFQEEELVGKSFNPFLNAEDMSEEKCDEGEKCPTCNQKIKK